MFEFQKTPLEGLIVAEPFTFRDERGILKKTFEKKVFAQNGIDIDPMEELETTSGLGVLRGLHIQTKYSQGKLIRVVRGEIFDVAVDLRRKSKTYGQYYSIYLSEKNMKMLYIPEGFAHGCLIMKENTTFYYLCSKEYFPGYDAGVLWNDKTLNINWPVDKIPKVILSEKDKNLPCLNEFERRREGDL